MKKILALLSITTLSLFSCVSYTFACSCIQPKPPLESLDDANVVFIGKVNSIETISNINKINFQVNKTIKWDETDTIQVTTLRDSATCGYSFEEWKDYIVYSNLNENNELNVSLCSRTNLLENATEDLTALNIEWDTSTTQNDEKITIPIANSSNAITIDKKIENSKIINAKKQKNIYIWTTVWIFAIFLIVFCMISMNNKKD